MVAKGTRLSDWQGHVWEVRGVFPDGWLILGRRGEFLEIRPGQVGDGFGVPYKIMTPDFGTRSCDPLGG